MLIGACLTRGTLVPRHAAVFYGFAHGDLLAQSSPSRPMQSAMSKTLPASRPRSLRPAKAVEISLRDGRSLRARRLDGKGSPLVLLHGLLDSSECWSRFAGATSHPSVAFDLPGFGGSDLPSEPLISAYAEDILQALVELDMRNVTLVGHSLGGAVAAALSELAPDRIVALVLLAPAGFGRIALAEVVSVPGVRELARAVLPRALRSRAVLDASYRLLVTAGEQLPVEVARRLGREAAALTPGAVMATRAVVDAGRSRSGFHRRRIGYYGQVDVLWGERDRVVPPGHAAAVLRALPQASVSTWEGMGHYPQRERPVQLAGFLEAACSRFADLSGAVAA